jgi:integrase
MLGMATEILTLKRDPDGYWRTVWWDDRGERHRRCFGRERTEARNRFAAFHSSWQANPRIRNPWLPPPITVAALWARYKEHAAEYYRRPDGTSTRELDNIADAMVPMLELFSGTSAEAVGPLALKRVRDEMIEADLCRKTINARIHRIRRVWSWAVSEEIVPAAVLQGLKTVTALAEGRSEAREKEPVKPVPEPYIWAVVEHLGPVLAAMVRLQYWTGARPGEVCKVRPCDVDAADPNVWVYRPYGHKTAWRGKHRFVLIGPNGQLALTPYLARPFDQYCFSPAESEAWRREQVMKAAHCHRPHVNETRQVAGVGDRYEPKVYAKAIARVCEDEEIPHWSPNQLRHNAGTRIRSQYKLEGARTALGHSSMDSTEIYAEIDLEAAKAIMARVG